MKSLLRTNFLGMKIRVKYSSNVNLEGIEGTVIDETKNMFIVKKADGKLVKIPKNACIFEFNLKGKRYLVNGLKLIGRLEKRVVNE